MTMTRFLLALIIAFGAMWSQAAAAPPTPLTPADGATWETGGSLTLTADFAALDYTDRSRLRARWSSSPATDANGLLASGTDITYPSFVGSTATFTGYSWESPKAAGAYYWQPYVTESYYPARPQEVGAIRTLNVVVPGGPTGFTVSGQSTAYSSANIYVSRSPAVGADGRLGSEVVSGYMSKYSDGSFRYTTYSWESFADTPGTYYWQVGVTNYSISAYSPVQTLVVAPAVGTNASGGVTRGRIPRWVGVQGTWSYRVNPDFGVPTGVSGAYFRELARLSGWRWGLTYRGTTSAFAYGRPDGISAVAFSYIVPPGSLGVTSTWTRRATRKQRVCKRGKCRSVTRRVRVIVEQDIAINAWTTWQQGPPYPFGTQYDLESVLIHEFGHMASLNNRHFTGCRNSPMTVAAAAGEYWRSENDWARRGCGAWAAENTRRFGKPVRAIEHRVLDLRGKRVPEGDPIVMP